MFTCHFVAFSAIVVRWPHTADDDDDNDDDVTCVVPSFGRRCPSLHPFPSSLSPRRSSPPPRQHRGVGRWDVDKKRWVRGNNSLGADNSYSKRDTDGCREEQCLIVL